MYTGTLGAVSNREDFSLTFYLLDKTTDAAVDITGCTIKVAIRPQDSSVNILTGSTDDGRVTIPVGTDGNFNVAFARDADMTQLCADFYDFGITIKFPSTGTTTQLMAAELPVVNGIIDA